jgi:hypothetical protein
MTWILSVLCSSVKLRHAFVHEVEERHLVELLAIISGLAASL